MDVTSAAAALQAAVAAQNQALQAYRPAEQVVVDAESNLAVARRAALDLRSVYDAAVSAVSAARVDLEAAALAGITVEVDSPLVALGLPGGSGSLGV